MTDSNYFKIVYDPVTVDVYYDLTRRQARQVARAKRKDAKNSIHRRLTVRWGIKEHLKTKLK